MTRRRKITLAILGLLILALLLMPLRMAMGAAGLDHHGLSARHIGGLVWHGWLEDARIGPVPLDHVDARLRFWPLLIGEAQLALERPDNAAAPLYAVIAATPSGMAVRDATGTLTLSGAMASLPVERIELTDVSVRFADGKCEMAEGQVRLFVAALAPGLDLANGMTGKAQCANDKLQIALTGQSGMEKLVLTLDARGHYAARLTVNGVPPEFKAGLRESGFSMLGSGVQLVREGRF